MVRMTTSRVLLALTVTKSQKLYELDLKNAFSMKNINRNCTLRNHKYMQEQYPNYVRKLMKTLHSLNKLQERRNYVMNYSNVREFNFTTCAKSDNALYVVVRICHYVRIARRNHRGSGLEGFRATRTTQAKFKSKKSRQKKTFVYNKRNRFFIKLESCYNGLEMKLRDKLLKERSQQPCKEWSNMYLRDSR